MGFVGESEQEEDGRVGGRLKASFPGAIFRFVFFSPPLYGYPAIIKT